ncbi:abnormal spindle-like microcephaly-associated protein homolog isoform X1 [Salvia hispanica]|uniref:abnormal spindle-like microcephaly-associated protein homolog isoform X1 n=1 Tax=Salvia hispanica TaxID=49212 RepID=UPI00200921A7|nr:abnormal spindle-like microcephaly-associated protein homolog isoform X1 [Salvia hispanica]
MDSRKRKPNLKHSSPLPNPPSSSIFRDISNLKTPLQPSKRPNFPNSPHFFSALKNTPSSSLRRCPRTSALKSKAARRLKAFESEQCKSARIAQSEKEKSLRSLARSLTVWLNFLFENPSSCGCDPSLLGGEEKEAVVNNGKRESLQGRAVGVDGPWRGPKRQRDSLWRGEGNGESAKNGFPNSMFSGLRASLQEICSFDDLKERMRMYLSLGGCKEIFEAMTQVTKNIDDGRLKMRASCPIMSDVGMKEKAMRYLMSYNPIWLRIGLYIILGGDSLLPNDNVNSEPENAFLRMVLEKQFFSHAGLAKAHAYNKQVEGLYRPGYYEKLGNVILKRFLLLVIIIDRAKCQTSLPLKYGIDGLDGGSPPMFTLKSAIKSSRQLVVDFLSSDVMHGEGSVVAHLAIVGYNVTYQQNPLVEYDFRISNLFEDLCDGIRLCRATSLLRRDSSILTKVVVPSDTQKKNLFNCGIALKYLREAGVSLLDEDGTEVMEEDVVSGDKELTLSLLWNMFVNLQLPLLINKSLISEEISNIRGVVDHSIAQTPLDLLLNWIQAVCATYELKVESHSSLLDGKAMWCLLDFYFRKEHDCSCSFKDPCGTKNEVSIMSAIEYTDAVHNFILSQKLTSLLGNFPEVLQVSDILEHNGASSGKSVIILLVFLSIQLLVKRNMDKLNFHKLLGFGCQNSVSSQLISEWSDEKDSKRDFKAIITWWQDMAQQNGKCSLTVKRDNAVQREKANAATIIQSHYRRLVEHRNYMRITNAALVLHSFILAWLSVKKNKSGLELVARSKLGSSSSRRRHLEKFGIYATLMADRHHFVNLRRSAIVIQQAVRVWLGQSHYRARTICNEADNLRTTAALTIQNFWKYYMIRRSVHGQHIAATKIQSHYRGWLMRECFAHKKQAIVAIQSSWKGYIIKNSIRRQHLAATNIQIHYRGWLMRKNFACKKQAIRVIQNYWKNYIVNKSIQHQCVAATKIQSHYRSWLMRRSYTCKIQAVTTIQNFWKDYIVNKAIRTQHIAATKIQSQYRSWLERKSFACKKRAIRTIQRTFQCLKSRREFLMHRKENVSAIIIQSHFRGWMARREVRRQKYFFVRMQSFCRGWIQRKNLQLQKDAAIRIQSAFNRMNFRRSFISQRLAAIDIQRYIRGHVTRRRLLGASCSIRSKEDILLQSALKLQRWWRHILLVRVKTKPAIVVQKYVRRWMARKMAKKEKQQAVMIQSYWKGYLARKEAKGQLLDLRLRMQKSAANVDDSRRLINRLVSAISELLNMRSVSGILHTCEILDMATELSEKCCEELVAAGAIATLLKLIRSVSRSIPDQQVLKHALSTLRNLARYPSLAHVLVESHGCVETVFLEFLKNKEEGYFIASELLKRICKTENGAQAIRKSSAILKRLNNLAEELTRKAGNDKRKWKNLPSRENEERRLKEVVELLKLIKVGARR